MSQVPEAVFFDVDGVLIDSLAAHLKFCGDRVGKLGLSVNVPAAEQFRELVQSGKKVSPMRYFFLAVGFPENTVASAVTDYEANFSTEAKLKIFDGAAEMLAVLHKSDIRLGLITSNVRKNVEAVLGDEVMKLFEPAALFFHDTRFSKAQQIGKAAEALRVDVGRCVFVGDQPADKDAAIDAGSKFVGVTYGWGFANGVLPFEVAENVSAIPMAVQRAAYEFSNDLQFDYAWKWFNFHADQRVKMFNYMFVGLGLFATAVAGSLGKGLSPDVPGALCVIAGVLAWIFSLLDKRNEYLVRLGEDVLFELEREAIFGAGNSLTDRQGIVRRFGILWRQEGDHPKKTGRFVQWFSNACQGRHRTWLRIIARLMAALFLIAGLLLIFGHVGMSYGGD